MRPIKTPNTPYPNSPLSTDPIMPPTLHDPSLREDSFNQLLQNRGVRFYHRKATPCPNMVTLDAAQHDPNCTICDHDGYMYYKEKEIWGAFIGNTMEKIFEYQGSWEVGSTVATFPTVYPDGEEADFNTMDKLVMPDFEIRLWELVEWKNPVNKTIYLRYPITGIEYIASAQNSSSVKEYKEGIDFDIVHGAIIFKNKKTPDYDPITKHGKVITISYFANPVFIVLHPLRELRVSQEFINGQKTSRRLPQQLVIKRDYQPSQAARASRN